MKHYFILFIIVLSTTNFAYGQKKKKVKETYADKLRTEIYYIENDKKNGLYEELFNKEKITTGTYTNDKRSGIWNFYDYSGKLNFSGSYDNGLQEGKWVYEYDGNIASELFFEKGEIDSINGYHENGQFAYRLRYNADSTGVVQSFYPTGQLKEFFSIKGEMLDGIYSLYFENGQLHRKTEYKAGEKYSILEVFDLQGNPIDGGDLHEGTGKIILYYLPDKTNESELKINTIQNYETGTKIGEKTYRKDGKLMLKNSLTEDKETLIRRYYNENGELTHTYKVPYTTVQRTNGKRLVVFTGDLDMKTDVFPLFPSGTTGLTEFLSKSTVYPREMQQAGASGRVICQFVVTPIGEIIEIKIMQSAGKMFDDEAVRIIREMPRFTPGLANGVPVAVKYTLPVNFRLQ